MATQFTLNDILEKAIQKEIGSRLLYINLSQKMKGQLAKDAFQELAQQEQGHRNLLEQYLRGELKGGTLSKGQAADYKIDSTLSLARNYSSELLVYMVLTISYKRSILMFQHERDLEIE